MILGDSLVVMNSMLQCEGMGGQVQMIYIDPLRREVRAAISSRSSASATSRTTTTKT